MLEQNIAALAQRLTVAKKLLILTGAGMSTACGIPDFRSPNGIWNGPDGARNQFLFSRTGFTQAPEEYYRAFKKMYGQFTSIASAAPYELLQQLGDSGVHATIATQNIDGLHARYASANFHVLELHGTAAILPCSNCGKRYAADEVMGGYKGAAVPLSNCCGMLFDTDITLFGDALPRDFATLSSHIDEYDYLLVLGSSLEVSPVNSIPAHFAKSDKALVNLQSTRFDSKFGLVIRADISMVLRSLLEKIAAK